MTTEEAKQYVLRRKAELDATAAKVNCTVDPLNFINHMIEELWSLFHFSVNIDFTKIPIQGVKINPDDGFVEYVIPGRFPLPLYMKPAPTGPIIINA